MFNNDRVARPLARVMLIAAFRLGYTPMLVVVTDVPMAQAKPQHATPVLAVAERELLCRLDSMLSRCAGMPRNARDRCRSAAKEQLADCLKKDGFTGAAGDSETEEQVMFENWDLEFDKPIAERAIQGNDCTITIQLGPPRPETFVTTDDPGWYCPYRIKGIPGEPDHKMFGGGEDAIGAIIGALCNLGAELNYRWKDQLGLNWFDTEHLGFLDIDKLPWSKERTLEERQRSQALIDAWNDPASTPEKREAAMDK